MSLTKPASRAFAVLKRPRYRVPQLVTYARSIVLAMTGNPRFPSPEPPLATLEAAIDALEAAEIARRARTMGTVPVRNDKRQALEILLDNLCLYVQVVANADIEHGASIIESAGIFVKRKRVLPLRVFAAQPGPVSGSVKLIAPRAGKYVSYEWADSVDGMKTWTTLPSTVRASTIVSGLHPGTTAYFRYRTVTKSGVGDWSDPVSIIVR